MARLLIERKHENSDYESRFTMEWRKDIQMLTVTLSDNNGINTIMVFDEADARTLKAYLEGEL